MSDLPSSPLGDRPQPAVANDQTLPDPVTTSVGTRRDGALRRLWARVTGTREADGTA